jgi:hypothetical protein
MLNTNAHWEQPQPSCRSTHTNSRRIASIVSLFRVPFPCLLNKHLFSEDQNTSLRSRRFNQLRRAAKRGFRNYASLWYGGLPGRRSISGMQQRCRSVAFQQVAALIFLRLTPVDGKAVNDVGF